MGVQIDSVQPGVSLPVVPADNGGATIRVDIQRPADTTAYTANDVINNLGGGQLAIRNAVRSPGGAAYLQASPSSVTRPTAAARRPGNRRCGSTRTRGRFCWPDNAAFTGTFGILQATGFQTEQVLGALANPAGSTIDKAVLENIAVKLQAAPGSRDLYFDLQTLTAFTPASGALYAVIFALVWI
jgi:hypothetical protein